MALRPCPNCKAQISDLAEICPKCGKTINLSGLSTTFENAFKESHNLIQAAKATLDSLPPPPKKPEPLVKEFKRTCKECGKVWHSLSEREEELKSKLTHCKTQCCGGTEDASATQCRKGCFGVAGPDSKESVTSALESVRKCPNCGSGNYSEETITYERKK